MRVNTIKKSVRVKSFFPSLRCQRQNLHSLNHLNDLKITLEMIKMSTLSRKKSVDRALKKALQTLYRKSKRKTKKSFFTTQS